MQREVSINALVLTIVVTQAVYKYSKNATSLVSPPFFLISYLSFSLILSQLLSGWIVLKRHFSQYLAKTNL